MQIVFDDLSSASAKTKNPNYLGQKQVDSVINWPLNYDSHFAGVECCIILFYEERKKLQPYFAQL